MFSTPVILGNVGTAGRLMAPGVLLAPLTVLSPGPRLAGTPSKGKKCGKR